MCNRSIVEIYEKEIRSLFCTRETEKASKILRKLYLTRYNTLTDMEEKRTLLYSLAIAEYMNQRKDMANKYIKMWIEEMDRECKYKNDRSDVYADALTVYCEINKGSISKEEYKEINRINYEIYKKLNLKTAMYTALYNMEVTDRNFNKILGILEDLHTMYLPIAKTSEGEKILGLMKQIQEEMKDICNIVCYSKVEKIIANTINLIVGL